MKESTAANGPEKARIVQRILLLPNQAGIKEQWAGQALVIEADGAQQGIAACYESDIDAVVADAKLIEKEGLQAFDELIAYCEINYIPIVVVVPSIEVASYKRFSFAEEILEAPIDTSEAKDVLHKLLDKRAKLKSQILIDPLTGVMNELFLEREVDKQLGDMKRSHDTLALVYVEIDGLAHIRRTQGHKRGNEISIRLADYLKSSLRPADSIGRYGEGFVLVLPKTHKDDALKLMGRLMSKFAHAETGTAEGGARATFSAKARHFVDASQPVGQVLESMPFASEELRDERPEKLIDGGEHEKNALKKLKIGIIDDDRIIRELLTMQLSDIGEDEFEVEARSFADGEAFFDDPWHRQNERFLLIIDRIMPKMDGLEILQRIRTQYDRRRYMCIMLTSRDSESEIALAIQRGANDYLIKPFSLKELRARIKRLLRGVR